MEEEAAHLEVEEEADHMPGCLEAIRRRLLRQEKAES
jgi:hypothetical protein